MRPDFDDDYRVMILEQPDGRNRAVATPEISRQLGATPAGGWPLQQLKTRLSDIGIQLHGADFVFYFPVGANLRPRDVRPDVAIRQLAGGDAMLFDAFEAAATEEDLDGASVSLDDWIVFGAFEEGRLVAVSSIYRWNDAPLADVGVVTLPGSRRKGFAAVLIGTCAARALAEGLQLQFRCQFDNENSRALAVSLGMQLFGIWTAETPEAD